MHKKFLAIIMGLLFVAMPTVHGFEDDVEDAVALKGIFNDADKIMEKVKKIQFQDDNGQKYKINEFKNEDKVKKQLQKILKRDDRKLHVKYSLSSIKAKRAKDFIKFIVGAFREKVILESDGQEIDGIIRFDAHRGKRFADPFISVECFADTSSIEQTEEVSHKKKTKKTSQSRDTEEEEDVSGSEVKDDEVSDKTEKKTEKPSKKITKSKEVLDEEEIEEEPTEDEENISEEEGLQGNTKDKTTSVTNAIKGFITENNKELSDEDALEKAIETLCKRKNRKDLIQLDTVSLSKKQIVDQRKKRLKRGEFRIDIGSDDNENEKSFLLIKGISNNIFKGQKASISYQLFLNDGIDAFDNSVAIRDIKLRNYDRKDEDVVSKIAEQVYENLLKSNIVLQKVCKKEDNVEHIKDKLKEFLSKKMYKYVQFPTLSRKSTIYKDGDNIVLRDDKIPVKKIKNLKKNMVELSFEDLNDGNDTKYIYLNFSNGLWKTLKIYMTKNKNFARGTKITGTEE